MITVERWHNIGHIASALPKIISEDGSLTALAYLATEIAIGGSVQVSPGGGVRVITPTKGGASESSWYHGGNRDMRVLQDFLYFLQGYAGKKTQEVEGIGTVVVDSRMNEIDPSIDKLLLRGPNRANIAILIACRITDPGQIRAHARLKSTDDLIAAIELQKRGDCTSIAEALAA